jgi:hypothetical protein
MHKAIYYIYVIPLFLSAISSLRAFRLKWPLAYRWFSVSLFLTLLIEVFAILWKDYLYLHKTSYWNFSNHNIWIYNISFTPQYVFYFFLYSKETNLALVKRVTRILIPCFIIFTTLNIVLIQGLYVANTYTLIVCCFIMLWLIASYFFQLLRQKEIIQLHREPLVWISIGAFFFHLGCLPFYIWFNTLVTASMLKAYSFLSIEVVLNSIMYSTYLIAFLCRKNFHK